MGLLKGGSGVICACACAGPSSTFWNDHYNDAAGYTQSGGDYGGYGCACKCMCVGTTLSLDCNFQAAFDRYC